MRGMVAADSCFRAFLYLHEDLGWGREALFNMRISRCPTFVTVSCPGQLIMVMFYTRQDYKKYCTTYITYLDVRCSTLGNCAAELTKI